MADTYPMVNIAGQRLSIDDRTLPFGDSIGFLVNHGCLSRDNANLQPVFDGQGNLTELNVIASDDMGKNSEVFLNWNSPIIEHESLGNKLPCIIPANITTNTAAAKQFISDYGFKTYNYDLRHQTIWNQVLVDVAMVITQDNWTNPKYLSREMFAAIFISINNRFYGGTFLNMCPTLQLQISYEVKDGVLGETIWESDGGK